MNYYNINAVEFVKETVSIDMSELYDRFLPLLPAACNILDAGCGTGRDTKAFLERGYKVTAFDQSQAMVEAAQKLTNQNVSCLAFQDIDYVDTFDGIWACASLLHIPRHTLPAVFRKLRKALRDHGVIYASFKYGDFEGDRNGRFYHDLTESSLMEICRCLWDIYQYCRGSLLLLPGKLDFELCMDVHSRWI